MGVLPFFEDRARGADEIVAAGSVGGIAKSAASLAGASLPAAFMKPMKMFCRTGRIATVVMNRVRNRLPRRRDYMHANQQMA